jgi:hypothetical protein
MAFAAAFAFEHWQEQRWFRWLAALLLTCSALFVWGLSLADQAFPPDNLYNPLVEYALPNWLQGNIARNFGTLLGLKAQLSLLPLLLILVVAGGLLFLLARKSPEPSQRQVLTQDAMPAAAVAPSHR